MSNKGIAMVPRMVSLMKSIIEAKEGDKLSPYVLAKTIGLSSYSVNALIELRVLQRASQGVYIPLISVDNVSEELAQKVLDKAAELAKSASGKGERKLTKVDNITVIPNPLAKINDDMLVAELRRRGYVGSILKSYELNDVAAELSSV